MELNDTLIGLLNNGTLLVGVAVACYAALTYGPRVWAGLKTKAADVADDLSDGDDLSIDKAFAALQTVKAWGAGRNESYARGVLLIEDNWLSRQEDTVDPS